MKTKLAVIFLSLSISLMRKCLLIILIFPFLMQVSCSKDDAPEITGIATINDPMTLGTITGTAYYVAKTGNDGNAGTIGSPWLTIAHAETVAVEGDVVYVRTGTYNEEITFASHNGTSTNPIIFENYTGESPVIDGTGITVSAGSSLIYLYSDYIQLKGFEIKNVNMSNHTEGSTAVMTHGDGCVVSYCKIHDAWGSAIGMGGDYGIAEYNTIYDCCENNDWDLGRSASAWGSAISARRYPSYCTIRHNTVHDVWGEGISTFEATHTTMEDNVIYDVYSAMLYISDARDCMVQRNFVYTTRDMNGSQVGLAYWNERPVVEDVYNLRNTLTNNIVYGCKRNFYSGNSTPIDEGTKIANNTFVNSMEDYCVQIGAATHTGGYFANNIIIQEGVLPCIYASNKYSLTYRHNLYNKTYDSDAVGTGDLTTTSHIAKIDTYANTTYYELLSTSPAVDGGTDVGVNYDFEGNARVTTPDIGAYEYGSQVDPVNPVYTSSAIANATPSLLEMTYNLALANIVPAPSAFAVMVNSAARTVNAVAISGTNVLLTLASPVVYGNIVTVAYIEPATNPLQISTGGLAASITARSVTNNCIPSTNQAPIVSISSPINYSSFKAPATINITVNASDIDGTISKVEFFNGSIKLGERTTTPYSFTWKNVTKKGTYSITAAVTDNLNSKTISTPVWVTVRK